MKYEYSLIINNMPENPDNYTYKFGNTKNIQFSISENNFCVTTEMTVFKKPDEIMSTALFADAVKKAALIHIIKYSRSLDIKKVTVKINGIEMKIFSKKKGSIFIYSLVDGSLYRKIPAKWNNDQFIQSLLNQTKSGYDTLTSALFAVILSKSKMYETERFNYMWLAFNGMYNYFWGMVREYVDGKIEGGDSEMNQLQAFMRANNLPTGFTDRKSADIIAREVKSLINREWNGKAVTEKSIRHVHYNFIKKVEKKLYQRFDDNGKSIKSGSVKDYQYYTEKNRQHTVISPYSYLFILLPYHVRCDMLHANEPLKLFSYEEEADIKLYRFSADILESYIDENLPKWFDGNYTENTLKKMAEQSAKDVKIRQ